MNKLFGYFLKGLLFVFPVLIIISILENTFSVIFPANADFMENLFIFLTAIIFVTLAGYLLSEGTKIYFKHKSIKTLSRFPFVGQIVTSIKKFLLILNFSKEIFERPVMIRRENGKEMKLGFITNENLEEFGLQNHSSVYIPNPFSFLGELVIVANRDLEPIKNNGSEVSNFILSGGLVKK